MEKLTDFKGNPVLTNSEMLILVGGSNTGTEYTTTQKIEGGGTMTCVHEDCTDDCGSSIYDKIVCQY